MIGQVVTPPLNVAIQKWNTNLKRLSFQPLQALAGGKMRKAEQVDTVRQNLADSIQLAKELEAPMLKHILLMALLELDDVVEIEDHPEDNPKPRLPRR